jgi:hypothetical protein
MQIESYSIQLRGKRLLQKKLLPTPIYLLPLWEV